MPSLDFHHVDVFCDRPYGGNSLPEFHDAPSLTAAQMLRITQEMRHFETIFLQPTGAPNTVRARIFDLFEELPFAGHPIIGAAAVLQHRAGPAPAASWTFDLCGRHVTVAVEPHGVGYAAMLDQGAPEFLSIADGPATIASAFSLGQADLEPTLPLEVASTGLRYLVVPLRAERIAEARVAFDLTALLRASGAQFAVLLDPTTREIRHWNYCIKHGLAEAGQPFTLAQGRFAGRPSQLTVLVDGRADDITSVKVGGHVALVGHGRLDQAPEPLV